jgi:serine/threonine protein kinase
MTQDQEEVSVERSVPLSALFTFEKHVTSTRTADLYAAIDTSSKVSVSVWKLRHPLSLRSDAVQRFCDRLEVLVQLSPPVTILSDYGIDSEGIAFVVTPLVDGVPLVSSQKLDLAEGERRFTSALRLIASLHDAGLVCGDLCEGSFWINRRGNVLFSGCLGSFDSEATATAMMPPQETLPYLSPEQKSGGGVELASDVFSLGVLGYRLFAGVIPFGTGVNALMPQTPKPLNEVIKDAPSWINTVLVRCLSPLPEDRYGSATAILEAINQEKLVEQQQPQKKSVGTKGTEKAQESTKASSATYNSLVVQKSKNESEDEKVSKPKKRSRSPQAMRMVLIMVGVFLGVIALGGYFGKSEDEVIPPTKLQSELRAHLPAIDSEPMKQAIVDISEPSKGLAEKEVQIQKIVSSDDPLAHAILVQTAVDAPNRAERELAEKGILLRAQRLGLRRSAEQVRQWLRAQGGSDNPPGYAAILKSLDNTLPIAAHGAALKEAYPTNPRIVLKLGASLALDTEKFDEYRSVLSALLSDTMTSDVVGEHSSIALILASTELNVVFADDAVQYKETIPDKDIIWLLRVLASRSDPHVRTVATMALERKLLTPLREIFAQLVSTRVTLPHDVLAALIRATAGTVTSAEIVAFGRWYDPDSERILLALCADEGYSKEMRAEIFETLLGKSLTIEPAASLAMLIQNKFWERRGDMAKAVGVLGFLDKMPQQSIEEGLMTLDALASDPKVVRVLLASQNTNVVSFVLKRYSGSLGFSELLDLLKYPDQQVKLRTIELLVHHNDVGALKLIIDKYEQETDPVVRTKYQESFWVIKQRVQQ